MSVGFTVATTMVWLGSSAPEHRQFCTRTHTRECRVYGSNNQGMTRQLCPRTQAALPQNTPRERGVRKRFAPVTALCKATSIPLKSIINKMGLQLILFWSKTSCFACTPCTPGMYRTPCTPGTFFSRCACRQTPPPRHRGAVLPSTRSCAGVVSCPTRCARTHHGRR